MIMNESVSIPEGTRLISNMERLQTLQDLINAKNNIIVSLN